MACDPDIREWAPTRVRPTFLLPDLGEVRLDPANKPVAILTAWGASFRASASPTRGREATSQDEGESQASARSEAWLSIVPVVGPGEKQMRKAS